MHPRAFLRDLVGVWRRHGATPALATLAHAGVNLVVPLEVMQVIVLHRASLSGPNGLRGETGGSGTRTGTDHGGRGGAGGAVADASALTCVSVTDPGRVRMNADTDAHANKHGLFHASHPPTGRPGHWPQITTALADEATLAELRRRGDWAIDEIKLAHWREGDLCLLSLVDGQPAGYTWVHERGCPQILPGLRLRLPPGMLYNFAGYTHPGFRGLGLQGLRHRAVLEHPRWASADTLLGWVKTTNHASRRGQARSGYVDIGRVLTLGAGTRAWYRWSSSLAAHGVRAERVRATPGPASPPAESEGVEPPT
ncbi:MAG: hypothetical protein RLZ83_51 [Pseudomonadota bacterium]